MIVKVLLLLKAEMRQFGAAVTERLTYQRIKQKTRIINKSFGNFDGFRFDTKMY